ncbi:hypothetical protein CRUP_008030 [Coryphaenoides rupestris]|nr:hypothetical protein CRUP_008030 [Coryphaenoides rupestris]
MEIRNKYLKQQSGHMSKSRLTARAPPSEGDPEWLHLSLQHLSLQLDTHQQGVSMLHVACLHGHLACVKQLVESGLVDVNDSCARGSRPVHMVLSTQSSPNSSACTDAAVTPLHSAAAEGLLACTEMLVHAGADVHARDKYGHTPLDTARSCCHRAVARYLKDCMWRANKKRELELKKQVKLLYWDLVLMSKLDDRREKMRRRALTEKKMEEWAGRKGLPLLQDRQPSSGSAGSQVYSRCVLSADPCRPGPQPRVQPDNPRQPWNTSTNPTRPPPPPAASKPPHTARRDNRPIEISSPEPDLRGSVTLSMGAGGHPQYTARMAFPRDFQPWSVLDLPHLRVAKGQSAASPWTEVALHLPEVLEPGHY